MTEVVVYKPWEHDSNHDVFDAANNRRMALFEEEIEGLQVKVKRTAEGKFVVKTRVPVPPKPVAKKKAAPKKAVPKKAATTKKTAPKKAAQTTVVTTTPTPSKTTAKKRPAKKTSRKRK